MIELIKQDVRTEEILCRKCSQTIVETDVIIPDIKPDIKKILNVEGYISITQKNIQQDKVYIQGIIKLTLLYTPENHDSGCVCSIPATQEFNHTVDCHGATSDMNLTIDAFLDSIDSSILNSRKINLRCVLSMDTKVSHSTTLSLSTDMQENDEIQLKKETLKLCNSTENAQGQIVIKEQLDVPAGNQPIGEILKMSVTPSSVELCMMENKAIAKGQVKISVLYKGDMDENSIQYMEHIIPFTEILDVADSSEDMEGEIEYSLMDILYEIREDSDGEARMLGVDIVLGSTVHGFNIIDIDAITDGYSLGKPISLKTSIYEPEQILDISTAELSHTTEAQIPPMLPNLQKVCDINSLGKISGITAENGVITVHGTINSNILYLTTDKDIPLSSYNHISEFSQEFSVPQADSTTVCDAHILIQHCSYTLSGDNCIDLRIIIGITLKSLKQISLELIESIDMLNENSTPDNYPCMALYFVQAGDTLWSIAKKYHTTIECIKSLNNLTSNTIYPQQQLKIASCRKIIA